MSKTCDELMIEICSNSNDIKLVSQNSKHIAWSNPYSICDFAEYVKLSDTNEVMKTLEDAIIRYDDIVHIYEFMFLMVDSNKKVFNLRRFEKLIKESKNPKLMAYCLAFVPGIDKNSMLDSLYKTRCEKYIEKLNDPEYEIDVNKLKDYQKNLEESKKFEYFPKALEKLGTKDTDKLIEIAININNPYIINELADYIEYLRDYRGIVENSGTQLSTLEKAQFHACINNPLHAYEYAASIKDSNKHSFQQYIIDSGMPKYMYYMYEYVNGINEEDKDDLKKYIELSGNKKYIKKIGINHSL